MQKMVLSQTNTKNMQRMMAASQYAPLTLSQTQTSETNDYVYKLNGTAWCGFSFIPSYPKYVKICVEVKSF